jgi:hypothetical protein
MERSVAQADNTWLTARPGATGNGIQYYLSIVNNGSNTSLISSSNESTNHTTNHTTNDEANQQQQNDNGDDGDDAIETYVPDILSYTFINIIS